MWSSVKQKFQSVTSVVSSSLADTVDDIYTDDFGEAPFTPLESDDSTPEAVESVKEYERQTEDELFVPRRQSRRSRHSSSAESDRERSIAGVLQGFSRTPSSGRSSSIEPADGVLPPPLQVSAEPPNSDTPVILTGLPFTPHMRAIRMVCELMNVSYRIELINPNQGESHRVAFRRMYSPHGQIPVLKHGDFSLTETIAIAKYLVRVFRGPEHLYPQANLQVQARVDEALAGIACNLGRLATVLFREKIGKALFAGLAGDPQVIQESTADLNKYFDEWERYRAPKRSQAMFFVAGTSEPTIADVLAACFISLLTDTPRAPLIPANHSNGPFPRIARWYKHTVSLLQPTWDDVSEGWHALMTTEAAEWLSSTVPVIA